MMMIPINSAIFFSVLLLVTQITSAEAGVKTNNLARVEKWLADHAEANIQSLIEFLSIPSVSADHERAKEVRHCAKWLASDLHDAGLENIELMETGGHPVVYADWLHAEKSDAPTVLIYGHYDVQPEDPVDLWTTPPFEPTVREGKLFARGASDDKGNMYVPIVAIKAYLKTLHKLPVNVKLLLEGEEEIGSPNLNRFLVKYADKFRADYSYSADGGMISPTIPGLRLSLRGIVALEITLRVANRDMHSGFFGGGVQNPIHSLTHLLSTLRDIKTGKILVKGYYDQVDDITQEDRDHISSYPIGEKDILSPNGVNSSVGEEGYSFLERVSLRPTIEVVGIWGGFEREGIKTVLPREAHAKIVCRTVTSQDPQRTARLLIQHLQTKGAEIPGVTVEVTSWELGGHAFKMNGTTPGKSVAAKVLTELYGRKPIFTRGGGSIPVVFMLHEVLSLETTIFGFASPDENVHAPNEFGRLESFRRGERAYVRLLNELASSHGKASGSDDDNIQEEL